MYGFLGLRGEQGRIIPHEVHKKGDLMKPVHSFSILMVAVLAACASVDESATTTTASTPAAVSSTAAPAAATGTRQTEARGTPMRPGTAKPQAPATKIGAPGKNSVYFDYDKDDIKPEFRSVLEQHAQYLRANPAARGRIEGNADERGSREYNLALGQRRAEAVMTNLKLLGIPESRLEAVSYGEEKPRRTGHEEGSWAENRRGDLVLTEGGK